MASGIPAGRLSIEVVAEVARLQQDMEKIKRAVKSASNDIARDARHANDNLAGIGRGAGVFGRAVTGAGSSSKLASHHVANLSFQLQDLFIGLQSGQRPMTVFLQQGGQIGQIMGQAGIGVGGLVKQIFGMIGGFVRAHPILAAIAAVLGVVALAFRRVGSEIDKTGEVEKYARSLGLTRKEMEELEKKTGGFGVTAGDMFKGLVRTVNQHFPGIGQAWDAVVAWINSGLGVLLRASGMTASGIYAAFVGAWNAIKVLWSQLPAVIGEAVGRAANVAIGLIEDVINRGIDGLNLLLVTSNVLLKTNFGYFEHATLKGVDTTGGAIKRTTTQIRDGYVNAYNEAQAAQASFYDDLTANIRAVKMESVGDAAAEIIADRSDPNGRQRAEKLSKEQKAAEAALKAAKDYADALAKETASLGLNAIEMKEREATSAATAAAQAALLAPTAALTEALLKQSKEISDNHAKWKARMGELALQDFDKLIAQLRAENETIGLSGPALDKRRLALEETAFKAEWAAKGLGDVNAAWLQYLQVRTEGIDRQTALDLDLAHKDAVLEMFDGMAERADRAATSMASAFGRVGDAIGQLNAQFAAYAADKAEADQKMAKAEKDYGRQSLQYANARAARQGLEIDHYRNLAGTAKTFFKEGSAGYKAMEAAEKAFALVQLANTAVNVAAGAAKMFAALGPWAFPVVAAMIGVMAALGFSGGGKSAAAPTAEDLQAAQGTGTVLGDMAAKSESIARSLDLMAENSTKGLDYSSDMVRSLRSIEGGIGALTATIARELNLQGGSFDQSGLGLGSKTKGLFDYVPGELGYWPSALTLLKIPVIGDILKGIGKLIFNVKTTVSLLDQGIQVGATSVQQILEQGLEGLTYQTIQIEKKKKLFGIGIGGSTKTETITGALDSEIERQMSLIVSDIYDTVVAAAEILGLDVADALKTFQVEIGKISFKDLKGDEINAALEAIFSKIGDQMAGFAVAGLEQFQQAGEGLYETLMRLAKNYLTVDAALQSIGLTFGSVGAASIGAREALILLMGGLDEFVSQINFYYDNFLGEAEKLAFLQGQIDTAFAGLGMATPATIEQFKALVAGADLTTTAGQELFASLMAIAPAFHEVATAAQEAADAAAQEQQQRIAAAADALRQAYSREASELQQTIDRSRDLARSFRELRAELFATEGSAGSYEARLAELRRVGTQAASGNPEAQGALAGVIRDFLPAAKARARTLLEYQRSVVLAASYASSAASAADAMASEAQRQLDRLTAMVGLQIDLNSKVKSIEELIRELVALERGGSLAAATAGSGDGVAGGSGSSGSGLSAAERAVRRQERREQFIDNLANLFGGGAREPANDDRSAAALERIEARLSQVEANTRQGALAGNKSARQLETWDRQGRLGMVNDDETEAA